MRFRDLGAAIFEVRLLKRPAHGPATIREAPAFDIIICVIDRRAIRVFDFGGESREADRFRETQKNAFRANRTIANGMNSDVFFKRPNFETDHKLNGIVGVSRD